MNKKFINAYLHIIKEQNEQVQKKEDEKIDPIDDLTKQNIITIAEEDEQVQKQPQQKTQLNVQVTTQDFADEQNQDQRTDGWDDDIIDTLDPIMSKMDSFTYEIKNCVKGCYTGAHNRPQLYDYLIELANEIQETAEQII